MLEKLENECAQNEAKARILGGLQDLTTGNYSEESRESLLSERHIEDSTKTNAAAVAQDSSVAKAMAVKAE